MPRTGPVYACRLLCVMGGVTVGLSLNGAGYYSSLLSLCNDRPVIDASFRQVSLSLFLYPWPGQALGVPSDWKLLRRMTVALFNIERRLSYCWPDKLSFPFFRIALIKVENGSNTASYRQATLASIPLYRPQSGCV